MSSFRLPYKTGSNTIALHTQLRLFQYRKISSDFTCMCIDIDIYICIYICVWIFYILFCPTRKPVKNITRFMFKTYLSDANYYSMRSKFKKYKTQITHTVLRKSRSCTHASLIIN